MSTQFYVGIVIKIQNYQDFDQIVTILCKQEIITFIALGVRKITSKNRVALVLGSIIEVEIFRARLQGKMSKLKKASLIHQPLWNDSATALLILEIMEFLKKINNPSEKLFLAAQEALPWLGKNGYNHHIKVYILTRLLDVYGYWPKWNECAECGNKKQIISFAFDRGGFICKLHKSKWRFLEELKAFQALGTSFEDYKNVKPEHNFAIFQELTTFLKNHGYQK